MKKQRLFQIGDHVRVRPFDEIDEEDVRWYDPPKACYGIRREAIDRAAAERDELVVKRAHDNADCYGYELEKLDGQPFSCMWAQGMLYPAEEDEPIFDVDPDSLMRFLTT